jgi:hypothetical protein
LCWSTAVPLSVSRMLQKISRLHNSAPLILSALCDTYKPLCSALCLSIYAHFLFTCLFTNLLICLAAYYFVRCLNIYLFTYESGYLSKYGDQTTGWTTEVRLPAGGRKISLRHRVGSSSRSHVASYRKDTTGYYPGVKVNGE